MKNKLTLFILPLLLALSSTATANWWDHHDGTAGTNGIDGVDGINGLDGVDGSSFGVSDSDFAKGLSLSFAMAGMDFTNTTTKLQLGISGSWYDGENSLAFGVAQTVDSTTFGDVMFSFKVGSANDHRAGVLSAIWKVQ